MSAWDKVRLIAATLNCVAKRFGEPCGNCEHCRAIAENRHIDVLEITLDEATSSMRAEIRDAMSHEPVSAAYKVLIVRGKDEALVAVRNRDGDSAATIASIAGGVH